MCADLENDTSTVCPHEMKERPSVGDSGKPLLGRRSWEGM